jgi:hypothetical protein
MWLMTKMVFLLHEVLVVSSPKREVLVVVSSMWKVHMIVAEVLMSSSVAVECAWTNIMFQKNNVEPCPETRTPQYVD